MLRWVAAVIGIALVVGAWLLLRDTPERVGLPRDMPAPEVEPVARPVAELREEATAPDARTLAASRSEVESTPQQAVARPTGVLAGRLLLDGAPLSEAAGLRLEPADRSNPTHALARGLFRTDALGRFRREDLPEDWSGTLLLQPPYVKPLVVAQGESWTRSIEVARLRQDLVIAVARRAMVRVRVLHADRTPAAGVVVFVRQIHPNGSSSGGANTDDQGITVIDRTAVPPQRIELSARTEAGATALALFEGSALDPSETHGDIDLGDVLLIEGRQVALRLVDETGTPQTDLRISVMLGSRGELLTTDDSGVATIGLASEAVEAELEAEGFWPEKILVPALVQQFDIALRRANRLRVEVVDAQDRPLANGRVRLVARHPLFGEGRHFPPVFLLGDRGLGVSAGSDSLGESFVELPLDAQGALVCEGIEAGLELRAQLRGPLGAVGAQELVAGLGESEQRTLRMRLERTPCTLEVRLIDPDARPVAGAEVRVRGTEAALFARTNAQGWVRFEDLLAARVELSARSEQHEEELLTDVAPCAGPITLRLARGRSLEVELRDGRGRATSAGKLALRDVGGTREFLQRTMTDGFASLPFEPLVLTWTLCGRERRLDIDPTQTSAVFELPTLGEVAVTVADWTPGEGENLRLRVEALDDAGVSCGSIQIAPALPHPVPLWPGRYRLTVEVRHTGGGSPSPTAPLGRPQEIQIDAGSTLGITFRP